MTRPDYGPGEYEHVCDAGEDESMSARLMRRRDQDQAAEFARTGWPVGADEEIDMDDKWAEGQALKHEAEQDAAEDRYDDDERYGARDFERDVA